MDSDFDMKKVKASIALKLKTGEIDNTTLHT